MVSVRKRKMARSAVKKVSRPVKKNFNPQANPVIKKYWDKNKTPKQNYRDLGLRMRLAATSGGEELVLVDPKIVRDNELEDLEAEDEPEDNHAAQPQEIAGDPYDPANILKGTAKIERDANGKVLRVVYGTKEPLAAAPPPEEKKEPTLADHVISELEVLAAKPRKEVFVPLDDVETARMERLERKHGSNWTAMKWDARLNPFQLSEGTLKKKFAILHKQRGQ